jgi:hypothetical protein
MVTKLEAVPTYYCGALGGSGLLAGGGASVAGGGVTLTVVEGGGVSAFSAGGGVTTTVGGGAASVIRVCSSFFWHAARESALTAIRTVRVFAVMVVLLRGWSLRFQADVVMDGLHARGGTGDFDGSLHLACVVRRAGEFHIALVGLDTHVQRAHLLVAYEGALDPRGGGGIVYIVATLVASRFLGGTRAAGRQRRRQHGDGETLAVNALHAVSPSR